MFKFLPWSKEKKFAKTIESFHKEGPVSTEQCNTESCRYRAMQLKDLADYVEKNFGKEELTKQYLQNAHNQCMNCPRDPENNECEDVFRRVKYAGHILINS